MSMDVPVCNGMVAESRIEIPIRDVTDVCVCFRDNGLVGEQPRAGACGMPASSAGGSAR